MGLWPPHQYLKDYTSVPWVGENLKIQVSQKQTPKMAPLSVFISDAMSEQDYINMKHHHTLNRGVIC